MTAQYRFQRTGGVAALVRGGGVVARVRCADLWRLAVPVRPESQPDYERAYEAELRQTFTYKKGMVVNLPAYRAQMIEIEEMLAELVQQLQRTAARCPSAESEPKPARAEDSNLLCLIRRNKS